MPSSSIRFERKADLVARVRELCPTALLVSYTPVGESVLRACPSLRIVSYCAVGYDSIDLDAATRHGVWVTNVPDAATDEVATHALAMALALIRRLPFLDRDVRDGGWAHESAGAARLPSELALGIVGMGTIGRRLASISRGLFGEVIGYDPLLAQDSWPTAVRRVDLDACLRASDVISLHVPLTSATRTLISRRTIALMKPGALLVNVSRGGVVDEAALIEALDAGVLAGAALDVTDPEPPAIDARIRTHPRILITPHAAFFSAGSAERYVLAQARNVIAWHRDGRPLNAVNTPAGSSAPVL